MNCRQYGMNCRQGGMNDRTKSVEAIYAGASRVRITSKQRAEKEDGKGEVEGQPASKD